MRDRYSLAVGLLFAVVILLAVIHQSGQGTGTLGLDDQPRHWPLPEFAVPLATVETEGEKDANVAQDDCETSQLPCPEDARRTPACRVHVRGAFPVCDLFGRPSVISFFTTGADCVAQQEVVNQVFERYRGRVAFLSVDLGDDRESVRELVEQRRWRMPVGLDRDGAVGALYRVAICPTFAYAFPGGTLHSASVGELTEAQLSARVEELLGATRAAEGREGAEVTGQQAPADREIGWEPAPEQGWVAPHVAAEFPGLGIASVVVDGRPGPSPEPVRRRLRDLSDRFYGAHAIHLRERPIPWAYRVFFRQIGLDPDRSRTPVEQLALERLQDGAFKSRGLPDDALTIAIVETGVALRVFDGEQVGRLCIRDAGPGEELPGRREELAQGTLVIADERGPVGLLFGEPRDWSGIEPKSSRRLTVVAVQVGGVPQISVDEALWIAAAAIESS